MRIRVADDADDLSPIRSPWDSLQDYEVENEGALAQALRSIPADMAEALELEPAAILLATARLHGLMAHWTTRLAYAKSRHTAAKSAKEVGLEAMKADRRLYLTRTYDKFTESMVSERAKATDEYARLCLAEARSEREYLRIKGLVDAIVTKREAIRILSFYMKPEMSMASNDFDMPTEAHESLSEARRRATELKKRRAE